MKPRLLIILNRLVVGGQSIDTIPLADMLKDDFTITVLYGEKEPDEMEYNPGVQGITFIKVPALKRNVNPLKDFSAIVSLFKIINQHKPAIVHTHGSKPGVAGRLAAWLANVPVKMHTIHGHLFHSYYNKAISKSIVMLERLLAKITTGIIVLSNEQKTEIAKTYHIAPASKIHQVALGICYKDYVKDKNILRNALREKYNLLQSDIAIGIIGRMVPVKNHARFIQIAHEVLKRTNKTLRFFFIGDGSLKKSLQQKLNDANISWSNKDKNKNATVIFTSWLTPVTEALHGMDIIALTSLNEGTPVSLIEAQAAGIPVVADDAGGVRDTFADNESGFLITDRTVAAFTEKLLLLIENEELRTTMGQKGSLFAQQKFSKQAEANAFRKLYADSLLQHTKQNI